MANRSKTKQELQDEIAAQERRIAAPKRVNTQGTPGSQDSGQERERRLKRIAVLGAAGSIILALMGLLGFVPGLGLLASVREGYIPMAPSTAISFIVLAGILLAMTLRSLSDANLAPFGALAALVSLFGALEIAGHLSGRDLNFEHTLVPSTAYLGEIPIARMSPSTGILFFLAGLAVLALLWRIRTPDRETRLGHWGGSLGILVFGTGLVFCLAYLYGSPLLYGRGATVPMALTTALAFLMLGAATVGVSGEDAIPLNLLAAARRAGQPMSARRRFLFLTFIMVGACTMVMMIMMVMLYRHDIEEHKERLQTTVQSQARLIEAMARHHSVHEKNTPGGSMEASLSVIVDAHEHYERFGKTGEFILARREGDYIVFLLRHRHETVDHPESVPFDSKLAEPIRLALEGLSGTVIGLDYRGETVLAAYEPVAVLNLGIVAKIDLAEIRAPFMRTSLSAAAVALIVVLAGTALFFWFGNPILALLEAYSRDLEKEIEERKRAEEAMRESEEKLRSFIDSAKDSYHLLNSKMELVDLNKPALDALIAGVEDIHEKEGIVGKHLFELYPFLEAKASSFTEVINSGKSLIYEDTVAHPTMGDMAIRVQAFRVGEGLGIIAEDITERKRAEEALEKSEERFRTSVENMLDCFGIYTAIRDQTGQIVDFRIEYVNMAACESNQMTRQEQIGKRLCELLPAHRETGLFDEYCQVVETGNPLAKESVSYGDVYKGRHVIRAFDIRAAKLGDGFAAEWRDITERKQAEEALQTSRTELETRNRIANVFLTETDETIYHKLLDVVLSVMESEFGYVSYIRENGDLESLSKTETIWDQCQVPDKNIVFPKENWGGLWGKSLLEQKPLRANEGLKVPQGHVPLKNALCVPIMHRGTLIGQIAVANKTSGYSDEDQRILVDIANRMAPILQARLKTTREMEERRLAEEALNESQKILLESQRVGQLGSYALDIPLSMWTSSDVLDEIFGIDDEFIHSVEGWVSIIHPDWQAMMADYFAKEVIKKRGRFDKDYQIIRRSDGAERWVHGNGELSFDDKGNPVRMIGTIQDITERKKVEQEKEELFEQVIESKAKLEALSSQMVMAQESERRYIARELHDEIGQELTAVSIQMGKLHDTYTDTPLGTELAPIMEMVDTSLINIRNLSRELRPSILDDLGLVPALRWLLKRQAPLGGFSATINDSGLTTRPAADVAIVCFRIVQEALTNILKHAHASKVELELAEEAQELHITIRDNGRGFDVAAAIEKAALGESMGLLSMEERASLIGGKLEITSEISVGTIINGYFSLNPITGE